MPPISPDKIGVTHRESPITSAPEAQKFSQPNAWYSYGTDLEARNISKAILPMAPCRKTPDTRSQSKDGRIDQGLETRRLRLQLRCRVSSTSLHSPI